MWPGWKEERLAEWKEVAGESEAPVAKPEPVLWSVLEDGLLLHGGLRPSICLWNGWDGRVGLSSPGVCYGPGLCLGPREFIVSQKFSTLFESWVFLLLLRI